VVLLVPDTSEIDLTRPDSTVRGAGELDDARLGVRVHPLHAFTPDGTPLGTVWAEILNRTAGASHAARAEKEWAKKHTPIEEKESLRWLTGFQRAREVAARLPRVGCVCVADSEADIYEVFAEPRGALDVLIRACQDRALELGAGGHLRDAVSAEPVLYTAALSIRGRAAKIAAETRGRRQNREGRRTAVEVRAATVTVRAPWRFDRVLPPVTLNVVLVRESAPPPGEVRVEWILLTTLPIGTGEQVRTIVDYCSVRWSIEILFRTLKSGCRIEDRRFEHIDRVLPCLALYLIVAWRTLFVCRLSRECPDVACGAVFEPSEWKAVWVAVKKKEPPKEPPRLAEMVHLIARLGGYIERPASEPGPQTVWIGLQRMYDLAWAWDTFGPGAKLNEKDM